MATTFTIGELAKAADVPSSTLRYYERIRLLTAEGRSPGNYRLYGQESLERVRLAIKDFDKFSLAALHTMTSLTGSALLSLANIAGLFELITIWQAAHLDEDWQMAKWGVEEGAKERRERRWQEMQAADKVCKSMLESTP